MNGRRLLSGAFQLRDARDVEAIARSAADDKLRRWGARLDPLAYDDLIAYLVVVAWQLSAQYVSDKDGSSGRGKRPSFADYLHYILRRRVVDWYRRTYGDSRYPRPERPLSLDGAGFGDDQL